jgi:hypothetical protein
LAEADLGEAVELIALHIPESNPGQGPVTIPDLTKLLRADLAGDASRRRHSANSSKLVSASVCSINPVADDTG